MIAPATIAATPVTPTPMAAFRRESASSCSRSLSVATGSETAALRDEKARPSKTPPPAAPAAPTPMQVHPAIASALLSTGAVASIAMGGGALIEGGGGGGGTGSGGGGSGGVTATVAVAACSGGCLAAFGLLSLDRFTCAKIFLAMRVAPGGSWIDGDSLSASAKERRASCWWSKRSWIR